MCRRLSFSLQVQRKRKYENFPYTKIRGELELQLEFDSKKNLFFRSKNGQKDDAK